MKRITLVFMIFLINILLFSCKKNAMNSNDVNSASNNKVVCIYGSEPDNINSYDDILKLFDDEYIKYKNTENFGWVNPLDHCNGKCNYSIYDIDNNGVDEMIVYLNNGIICYLFTMENGIPKCLINSMGWSEIQFSNDYSIIGDNIIKCYERCSTDYTKYVYYKINDNKLVEFDYYYAGFINPDNNDINDNYEYVILHKQDGKEEELDYDSLLLALRNYDNIEPVKREVKIHTFK